MLMIWQFRSKMTARIKGVRIRDGIPFSISRTLWRSYRAIPDPSLATVNPGKTRRPKSQAEADRLKKKFAEQDLQHLSLRKPGLIERIINNGTKKVAQEFSSLTDPNTL